MPVHLKQKLRNLMAKEAPNTVRLTAEQRAEVALQLLLGSDELRQLGRIGMGFLGQGNPLIQPGQLEWVRNAQVMQHVFRSEISNTDDQPLAARTEEVRYLGKGGTGHLVKVGQGRGGISESGHAGRNRA